MSIVETLSPLLRKCIFQKSPQTTIEQHLHLCRLHNNVKCLYFNEKTTIWKMSFSELYPYLGLLKSHFDVEIEYRKNGYYIVQLDII